MYAPKQREINFHSWDWKKFKSVILSSIDENMGVVDTVYTASHCFYATAHLRGQLCSIF